MILPYVPAVRPIWLVLMLPLPVALFFCGCRADIVRPNVSPPEMAKHVVKSDGVSTLPSASSSGLDGVIDVN